MSIYEKLAKVQQEIKVPKGQYNSFGGYSYRSCEDILEAAKPLLQGAGLILILGDELVNIGSRYYVKATATLTDMETGEAISTSSYAREEEDKKGMDGSQITGAASSYARKYALNGLFCLDDVKDSDTTNKHEDKKKVAPTRKAGNYTCSACGTTINQAVKTYSEKKYKKSLCRNCQDMEASLNE